MQKIKSILIVEDEAIIAEFLRIELETRGFNVCGLCATGMSAVKMALENKPDLILMDINLVGDIDGIQAAEMILDKQEIPIIFMTGYSLKNYDERVRKLSPLEYLIKPIAVEEIVALIDKLEK